MFFKAFKDAQGDESKINIIHGALQISFFAEVCPLGIKHTREGEGHANEDWHINPEVVTRV